MSVNDMYGFPLGRNPYGRSVNLDTWCRSNNNMLVVGAVGSGKTVAMRHILLQQFYRGAAIILIDLNGDYKDFCKTLGGCWIDADSDYVTCPPEVLSAQLLVFDLSDLNRATDGFRFSHYSKVLSWAWQRMSANSDERVLIVIDDFYSFVLGSSRRHSRRSTEYHYELLRQFAEVYRGAKYYNGGVYIVTSVMDDFIDEIARETSHIMLMSVASRQVNFTPILDMYGIPLADREFLSQGVKWTSLLIAGRDTELVSIEIPEDEVAVIKPKKWRFF